MQNILSVSPLMLLRRIAKTYWALLSNKGQYYLKLEGYYYCKKSGCLMAVLQVRGKRTTYEKPVKEIIFDKDIIQGIHPVEACVLGSLASKESLGCIVFTKQDWDEMKKLMHSAPQEKSQEPLTVIAQYYSIDKNTEITVLKSTHTKKEISIPTIELAKNPALLYALDSFQAISIGYTAGQMEYKDK
ncbi:MAG: hypothetical protein Q7V63_07080 [Gammaproteobacteria bacterium]|nr:hypothetical protein [Gammaproteobacteria bacterium]